MLDKKHIEYFKKILPKEFVFSEPGDCWAYGYDNSKIHVLPECVLFAENKSQIQNIVIYCNKNQIPITTRGRGTGNTGGSVPTKDSIVSVLSNGEQRFVLMTYLKGSLSCHSYIFCTESSLLADSSLLLNIFKEYRFAVSISSLSQTDA